MVRLHLEDGRILKSLVENADGSAFEFGVKICLEPLQGITNLRGITITARGAEGEILYKLSISEDTTKKVAAYMIGVDSRLLIPSTLKMADGTMVANESEPAWN